MTTRQLPLTGSDQATIPVSVTLKRAIDRRAAAIVAPLEHEIVLQMLREAAAGDLSASGVLAWTPERPIDFSAIANQGDAPRSRGRGQTFAQWAAETKAAGKYTMSFDDPIFSWAERVGIPDDFMVLAWRTFRRDALASGRLQRDWRANFRDHVKRGFLRLWYSADAGGWALSTTGKMAALELMGEAEYAYLRR